MNQILKDPQEQARIEFGQRLRSFRNHRNMTLRDLANCELNQGKQQLSRSQLGRYEQGKTLPKLSYAEYLDRLYHADGWIEIELANLWSRLWDPWLASDHPPKRMYFNRWPKAYSGWVWIQLKPTAQSVDQLHHIDLSWGPWQASVDQPLSKEGLFLTTGKAETPEEQGKSTTMDVECDQPTFVLFGSGEPYGGANVLDIRKYWKETRPERW